MTDENSYGHGEVLVKYDGTRATVTDEIGPCRMLESDGEKLGWFTCECLDYFWKKVD